MGEAVFSDAFFKWDTDWAATIEERICLEVKFLNINERSCKDFPALGKGIKVCCISTESSFSTKQPSLEASKVHRNDKENTS